MQELISFHVVMVVTKFLIFMFLSKLGNFKEAEFESKKVLDQTLHHQNCTHSLCFSIYV